MTSRFDMAQDAAQAYNALFAVTKVLEGGVLPKSLKHLVDLRVSQLNGCSFCINLHTEWALGDGERQQRLDAVAQWRQSALFTPSEMAALDWAEALTERRTAQLDDLYAQLIGHFTSAGIAELTMAVSVVNAWNRVGIACHPEHAVAAA